MQLKNTKVELKNERVAIAQKIALYRGQYTKIRDKYEQQCKLISQLEMEKQLLEMDITKPLKEIMQKYRELEEKFGHKDDMIEFQAEQIKSYESQNQFLEKKNDLLSQKLEILDKELVQIRNENQSKNYQIFKLQQRNKTFEDKMFKTVSAGLQMDKYNSSYEKRGTKHQITQTSSIQKHKQTQVEDETHQIMPNISGISRTHMEFEPILNQKRSIQFDETLQLMEGNPYETSRIMTLDETSKTKHEMMAFSD